jgi:lipopolysaccharide export system permease protein
MVFAITNTSFQAFLRSGVFMEADDTTLLIDEIRPDGVGFARIFLYEQKDNGEVDVITAREGQLGYSESGTTPLLKLVDGVRLTLKDNESSETEDDTASLSVLDFDVSRTNLGHKAAQLFRPRGKDEREFTLTELWERRFDPPPGVRSADMIAEFHGRLVKIGSVIFLVFLAIPLSLGRRRSERSFGMAIGLVVLVVYNQVLDLGENVTETGQIEPWLGLWLPFGIFAVSSLYLFYRASVRVPGAPSFGMLDPNILWLRSLLPRRIIARKKKS